MPGQRNPWRWVEGSLIVIIAAIFVVVAVTGRGTPPPAPRPSAVASPARPSPPLVDPGIAHYIDLPSLDVTISRLGWGITGGTPPVSSDMAQSMALATKSANALLPAGSPPWYRLIVLTVTINTLSSPQWHNPCVCWIVEVVVDPTPPVALACPDAKPPVRSEGVVVLIDAVSGAILREVRGGGLPWVAGRGCPALNAVAG